MLCQDRMTRVELERGRRISPPAIADEANKLADGRGVPPAVATTAAAAAVAAAAALVSGPHMTFRTVSS